MLINGVPQFSLGENKYSSCKLRLFLWRDGGKAGVSESLGARGITNREGYYKLLSDARK